MTITSERLKALRKARGYSQQDVANLLGVGRTTYLKYENGDNKPSRKLNELAKLFQVSADYLLGLTDSPVRHLAEMDPDERIPEYYVPRDANGNLRNDKMFPVYHDGPKRKEIPAPELQTETASRDAQDVQKQLQEFIDALDPKSGLICWNGPEPLDDETRSLIRTSLETTLRAAKQLARAKAAPQK